LGKRGEFGRASWVKGTEVSPGVTWRRAIIKGNRRDYRELSQEEKNDSFLPANWEQRKSLKSRNSHGGIGGPPLEGGEGGAVGPDDRGSQNQRRKETWSNKGTPDGELHVLQVTNRVTVKLRVRVKKERLRRPS